MLKSKICLAICLAIIITAVADKAIAANSGEHVFKKSMDKGWVKETAISISQARREVLEDVLNMLNRVQDIKTLEKMIKEKIENNKKTKECLEKADSQKELISCRDTRIKNDEILKKTYKVNNR